MFETLKNFLNKSRGVGGQHITGASYDFVLLDPKHVSNQFNIKELAVQNGQNESPESAASSRDPIEDEIASHFNALEIDQGNIMAARIESYQRSLHSLSADLDLVALEAERVSILNEAKAAVGKSSNDLYSLDRNFKAADSELKEFIAKNKLERKAPQNQSNRVLNVGILAFFFLIESIINTQYFSEPSGGGRFGGLVYAVLISALNLGLPFFAAWKIIPYKNSVDIKERYLGWLGVMVLIALVLSINLLSGHIRVAMQIPDIGNEFERVAMNYFLNNPFYFDSPLTYGFTILGLLFAAFAVLDGYKFDDPYPNFGPLWRNAEKITLSMQRHYGQTVDDVNFLFNEFNNELQKKLKSIDGRKESFRLNTANINNLRIKFDAFQNQLSNVYKSVISEYRTLNSRSRKTPSPQYFKQPIKYQITYQIEHLPSKKFYDDIDYVLKEANRDLPKMILKMELEHQKLIKKIPKLVDLIEI